MNPWDEIGWTTLALVVAIIAGLATMFATICWLYVVVDPWVRTRVRWRSCGPDGAK
jgi:uncharacterized membrane protein